MILLLLLAAGLPFDGSARAAVPGGPLYDDATPPAVALHSPERDSHWNGQVPLKAYATDDVAISSVRFFVGATPLGYGARDSSTSDIYRLWWDSTSTPEGPATVTAVATDSSGNTKTSDGAPITIDRTPPRVTVDPSSPVYTNQSEVVLSWSGTDNYSPAYWLMYSISVDSQYPTDTLDTSLRLTNLSEGRHTLSIQAKDFARNLSNPLIHAFIVDRTKPYGYMTVYPGQYTSTTSLRLVLDAQDPLSGSGVSQMRLRNGAEAWPAWEPYSEIRYWTIPPGDGAKSVSLQFRDNAGNESDVVQQTVILDTVPPETTLSSDVTDYVNRRSASFTFTASEEWPTFQCSLDGAAYDWCTSPVEYSALAEGPHVFQVKSIDQAGNVERTPAAKNWTVDTTKPVVTAPVHALDTSTDTGAVRVRLSWCASGCSADVAGYELQQSADGGTSYATVPLPAATAKTVVRSLPTGANRYRFRVRARDRAGNWGDYRTGPTFALAAYQEDSAGVTYPAGAWSRGTVAGSFGGYVRYASAAGASARLDFPSGAKTVAWVSNRAASRGKADVYVDGARVATLDLYRAASQVRQVVFSRAVDPRYKHVLEVRVRGDKNASSSGTRIDVDGFVLIR
jgi:hypothetical protein